MSKSKKKINTLLIIGVLGIWGFVIYRFVTGLGGNDEEVQFSENISLKQNKPPKEDTFSLLLTYADPFLSKQFVSTEKVFSDKSSYQKKNVATEKKKSNLKNNVVQNNVPVIMPVIPWPRINYSGMIRNESNKVVVGMFSIDNTSYIAKSGETVNGIKILSIYGDSVRVEFNKEKKTIRN